MITYEFFLDKKGFPVLYVEEKYYMLWELGSCKMEYIDIIISKLEELKLGKISNYSFGYERFCINCNSGDCMIRDEFKKKDLIAVATNEIRFLIKEWKEFYQKWEREKK